METEKKPFWHEVPNEERAKAKEGLTVAEFSERFQQPAWCQYPDALAGQLGCWSLALTNNIHGIVDCGDCEFCKHHT